MVKSKCNSSLSLAQRKTLLSWHQHSTLNVHISIKRAKSKTAITFHNNVDQTPLVLLVFNISPCFKKFKQYHTITSHTFTHSFMHVEQ